MAESGSTPARKASVKASGAKKAPASKTAAKKTAGKKAVAKKSPAKKTTKNAAPAASATKQAEKTSPAKKRSRLRAARELARSAPMSKYFTNARTRATRILDDPEALRNVAEESYRSGA